MTTERPNGVDEKPTATVYEYGAEAHDGAGWYYVDDEYPEEGSCGAFAAAAEAIAHAAEAGYAVTVSP